MTDSTPDTEGAPSQGAADTEAPRAARSRLHVRRLELGPVLTAADVGALLGLQSVRAARSLIVREGIPHVRLGKRLVVLRSSFVGWLRARERVDDTAARVRSAADRLRRVR